MIDYKDLMIGNWVYLSEKSKYPMRVQTVGEDYCYLNFEGNEADPIDGIDKYMMPIEVTEELLEKIGFEKNEIVVDGFRVLDRTYDLPFGDCFIEIREGVSNSVGRGLYCHIDNCAHSTIGGFDFQYLHELQNGIRLITKNDLDIKL